MAAAATASLAQSKPAGDCGEVVFVEQEAEVAAGIVRFIRGGRY